MKIDMIVDDVFHDMLRTSIVRISHQKLDGEERTRSVTLAPEMIPGDKMPKTGRQSPEGMLRVFDVDLQEWRTIILNSVVVLDHQVVVLDF